MTTRITVDKIATVQFKPAPIPETWVLDGNPVASNAVLTHSRDKLALTLVWRCTPGSFRWFYDEDETIQLLEGAMTLVFDDGAARRCGPGDVVFFPAGTSCVWIIERTVKKLAFFREPAPSPIALGLRLVRKMVDRSGYRTWQRRRYAGETLKPAAPTRTPRPVRAA